MKGCKGTGRTGGNAFVEGRKENVANEKGVERAWERKGERVEEKGRLGAV